MSTVPLATAAVLATVAAFLDLRSRRIPNWLTASGLVVGIGLNFTLSGWHGAGRSLEGAALGLAVLFPFVLLRSLGGGDWKLVGAVGALVGPSSLLTILLWALLLAGVMALALIIYKRRLMRTLTNIASMFTALVMFRSPGREVSLDDPESLKIPFAVPMGFAVVIYCAHHIANLSSWLS